MLAVSNQQRMIAEYVTNLESLVLFCVPGNRRGRQKLKAVHHRGAVKLLSNNLTKATTSILL